MIGLHGIANRYDVSLVDPEGFDRTDAELLPLCIAAVTETIELAGFLVDKLGPESECPGIFLGDLKAAKHRLAMARADLSVLRPAASAAA